MCFPTTSAVLVCFAVAHLIVVQTTVPAAAFLAPTTTPPRVVGPSLIVLEAKKRRRRRVKPQPSQSPEPSSSSSGDLPDFEMQDEVEQGSSSNAKNKPLASSSAGVDSSLEGGEVTANMMGSSDKPVRSVKELISDRSLERKFEFDAENVDDDIPANLADLAAASTTEQVGKKRSRQASRKAAAQARSQNDDEDNILAKIPFVTDDDGKVLPTKILEAGAWFGIFLLVLWEVYLNSPLFERVAPMAPVIY